MDEIDHEITHKQIGEAIRDTGGLFIKQQKQIDELSKTVSNLYKLVDILTSMVNGHQDIMKIFSDYLNSQSKQVK